MNPLASIEEWFDQLPPDHQKEIAMAVLFAAPDVSLGDLTRDSFDAVRDFRVWLSANTDIAIKRAGKALVIRSVIDVFVMHGKKTSGEGTLRDWAQAARAEGDQELAKVFEQAIPRQPFVHRQWQRSLAQWHEIRATALADEALNASAVGKSET